MTCDIWDTDYNSDNWEPEFITIFVAWQLRVTLDSIRHSCDVFDCMWITSNTKSTTEGPELPHTLLFTHILLLVHNFTQLFSSSFFSLAIVIIPVGPQRNVFSSSFNSYHLRYTRMSKCSAMYPYATKCYKLQYAMICSNFYQSNFNFIAMQNIAANCSWRRRKWNAELQNVKSFLQRKHWYQLLPPLKGARCLSSRTRIWCVRLNSKRFAKFGDRYSMYAKSN